MANYVLKRKYQDTNENWFRVWNHIEDYITKEEIDKKIEETVQRARKVVFNKRCGYAWSGGKDSIALEYIMRQLGINFGLFLTTRELNFTSFNKWLDSNIPEGVIEKDIGLDWDWHLKHQKYVMKNTPEADQTHMRLTLWDHQNAFAENYNLEVFCFGRRTQDANFCGREGIAKSKNSNTIKYSPLYDWKHEDVLGLIYYYDLPMPPGYFDKNDPRSWIEGTTQWLTRSTLNYGDPKIDMWRQIYKIEKGLVERSAKDYPEAKQVVEENNI